MTLMRDPPRTTTYCWTSTPRETRGYRSRQRAGRPRRNGARLQQVTAQQYDRCFQHASTVLWKMQGKILQPQDLEVKQGHPISEEEAVQIRLLMDAMEKASDKEADTLGRAIADMHPCESSWWYACAKNRNRPRKVLEALILMYG